MLKNAELEAEKSVVFPIVENMKRVKDGDILVSDMYLPEQMIRCLLQVCGFKKEVTIFVTPRGKSDGTVWRDVLSRYSVTLHVGDNYKSDVEIPNKLHGIKTEHYTRGLITPIESLLYSFQCKLTPVLREFRLSNCYEIGSWEHALYDLQATCNIPMLLLQTRNLQDIATRENLKKVLLTTRDCCLLEKLWRISGSNVIAERFHSSRHAYKNADDNYREYLKKCTFTVRQ